MFVDLSNVDTGDIIGHCDAILAHHTKSCVFLGFVEPGWMLEHTDQTRLRELFRKFPVGFVCQFEESIPFSWKNETEILYRSTGNIETKKNGDTNTLNDGGAV